MAATSPKALCAYCEHIPLEPLDLANIRDPTVFRLGRGDRVANSDCPFCRLVTHAYFEWRGEAPNATDENVHVVWMGTWISQGPSGRPAFFINRSRSTKLWICFTHQPTYALLPPTVDNYDFRYAKILTDDVLDIPRVSRWISACEKGDDHAGHCQLATPADFPTAFPGLEVLRLIDVNKNCLVETRSFPQYMALSYIWGAVPNFRLTTANRPKLLVPGVLSEERIVEKLPRTIRDAMALVHRLGETYLWVDALCLLQNDADDLGRGIGVMDLIYERAWLTIIAASGHDANAGLSGIRNGTRRNPTNSIEVKPGVSLAVVSSVEHSLGTTVYNSRAWTFQEQVLSRRQLYFINDTVHFRCRCTELTEACLDPEWEHLHNPSMGAVPGLSKAAHMAQPVADYCEMLMHYSRRVMTHEDDALRAMSGIIRRFGEAMGCEFLEGLPTAMFDAFVPFRCPLSRRRSAFPSYSWTGWRGAISLKLWAGSVRENLWFLESTWITWYKRGVSGVVSPIWNPEEIPSLPRSENYVGYGRERSPFLPRKSLDGFALPYYIDRDSKRTAPSEQVKFDRPPPTYPMLQFWTLALYLNIRDIDVFGGVADIAGKGNKRCGVVWLDGFEETTLFQQPGPGKDDELTMEFILLSEGSKNERPDLKIVVSDALFLPWAEKVFNLMLLEWRDGIAERRGMGWIYPWGVVESLAPGPVWKEIFLA